MFKKKYHWYLMSYQYNGVAYAAAQGLDHNYVTIKDIDKGRKSAKLDVDAPMMACCYLGHMTIKQMAEK